ncbi:MAG: 50S ribosomal protein L4, partial [Proteobacteria bacterium SW_6_67_9]
MELKTADGATPVQVADAAFGKPFNEPLVHQAVETYLAGARRGTKAQKTRAQVSGGGRKPWRQKGTGNARAGTIRSPIWVGGGTHFAAKPRDFSKGLNRKMYRGALRSILSELARQERLAVIDELGVADAKTKTLAQRLDGLGGRDALVVLAAADDNARLAARNLPHADVVAVHEVNPVNLLRHERVVATVDAVKR